MIKFSDLLIENHCTDWARTGVTSFGCQFDFHYVIYRIEHTIDGVTSFSQLMDIKKMYVRIRISVQTRVTGNSNTLFKMAESL